MAPLAPCWIQIPCSDVDRAAEFYKAVLDFNIDESYDGDENKVVWFNFNGTPLESHITGGFVQLPPELMNNHKPMGESVYFYADDLEEIVDRVSKYGGRVLYPRRKVKSGWISGFVDTEGNAHGVYTSNPAK